MVTRIAHQASTLCLPSHSGYISVSPTGRYFQDDNGAGFIVIGQNDAITWPGLISLLNGAGPDATEHYIADLRAHGVTVSRVMLEYAQHPTGYLETTVGNYSEQVVQFWDDFIPLAEKHGLYLLLTPYDTFWQNKRWKDYPYQSKKGGPCKTKHDWLTNPAALDAQKARWEFVIKRWGGSPNIFAWDLMNEVDYWWNATPREIHTYISQMAAHVRQLEQTYWGRTHLLTASSATPIPGGQLGSVIYNHPDLDFANTHLYVGPASRAPKNSVAVVSEIGSAVEQSLQAVVTPRPYFDSETGPIDRWIKNRAFDKAFHHNLSWAHLMSGAAGSGMRWPYTTPHWILPECRANLLGMARFAAAVDWAHFDSRNITQQITLDTDDLLKIGCADRQTAVLWLLRDTRTLRCGTLDGLSLTLCDVLDDGEYHIEYWDTYQGELLETGYTFITDSRLSITLPTFEKALDDVAIFVQKTLY